jgi:hypothetical protein
MMNNVHFIRKNTILPLSRKSLFFLLHSYIFVGGRGAVNLSSFPPRPLFQNYSFLVHHLVHGDDMHLLVPGYYP